MNTSRSDKVLHWILPSLAVLAVLLVWQATTAGGVFRPTQFPTMTNSMQSLWAEFTNGRLWDSVQQTLIGWILGMASTVALGLVVGTLLASNEFLLRSASSVIEIFKAIPAIAILPIVILVAGSTMTMKVFLIWFAAFWPFVIQVIYGVRSMDSIVSDTARALGVNGLHRFFTVSIPSASPYLVTGMRIASAQALILSVVAELVGGTAGLGRSILLAQNSGTDAYPTMYAYILVAGLLGILLTGGFFLMERKVMHWHESQRNIKAGGGGGPL